MHDQKMAFDSAFCRMVLYSRTALPLDFGADPVVRAFCGSMGGLNPGYRTPVEETVWKYVTLEWSFFLSVVIELISELRRLPVADPRHLQHTCESRDSSGIFRRVHIVLLEILHRVSRNASMWAIP